MPSSSDQPLLAVSGLRVAFHGASANFRAVHDVSFAIKPREMLALVGESGSGKTLSALSLLGLLPAQAFIEAGQAHFHGQDLLTMPDNIRRQLAGSRLAMIFQEPMTALNPVLTVGWQIGEVLRRHQGLRGSLQREQTLELLHQVGIPDPEHRIADYPHQLSGGMRQRAMIAMALAGNPELLIADEPTTALDVTVQAQIMELLQKLRHQRKMAILLITHNLALVSEQADRVAVMYAGQIVETADSRDLFRGPQHPYTRLLLHSVPSAEQRGQQLAAISGTVPKPEETPAGCHFAPRCPLAMEKCHIKMPDWKDCGNGHQVACFRAGDKIAAEKTVASKGSTAKAADPVLQVKDLQVWFPRVSGLLQRVTGQVKAVDKIDLALQAGETLALVGESGCGKTTVGKALVGLAPAKNGLVRLPGKQDFQPLDASALPLCRQTVQMIFQDPFSSLDPRLTIAEIISEGLEIHHPHYSKSDRLDLMSSLMVKVGLPVASLQRYPHQFSGGQRQRVGLARGLATSPQVLICDECTSALDVSVQAQILNLLQDLQAELGLAYLFITHDLSVVSFLATRVAVMYLGRLVESGLTAEVLTHPHHPYTHALLASAPTFDEASGIVKLRLAGDVPSPINPPSGCHFHPRCPYAQEICRSQSPPLQNNSSTHLCACHFPL